MRDGALFAVPFDADAATVAGGAVPLVEGVQETGGGDSGGAFYAVSGRGDLSYVSGFSGGSQGVRLAYLPTAAGSTTMSRHGDPRSLP